MGPPYIQPHGNFAILNVVAIGLVIIAVADIIDVGPAVVLVLVPVAGLGAFRSTSDGCVVCGVPMGDFRTVCVLSK